MSNIKTIVKQNYHGFTWGVVIAAIICLLLFSGVFDKLEKSLYDWRIRHNTYKKITGIPKISIIGITDEDMKQFSRWPLPRRYYAEIIDYLKKGGASVIAMDIFFDMPDKENPENDKALSDAIKSAGMVILPAWSSTSNLVNTSPKDGIYRGKLNENIDIISEPAKGMGHLNVFYDIDGVTRRVPIQVASFNGDKRFIPLSLAAVIGQKETGGKFELNPGNSLKIDGLNIPLDSKSCMPINYINFEEQVYVYHGAHGKWLERIGNEKPITLYSFSDVLKQGKERVPAVKFKDNIVLVGITAPGSEQDVHVTPFGRKFGIFIQANLVYNFLTESFIKIPGRINMFLIITGLSITIGILIFRARVAGSTYLLLSGGTLLLFTISVIITFISLVLYQRFNIMIEMIPFLFMFLIHTGGCLTVNLSSARQESAMRGLELDLLLDVGEITTHGGESNQYSLDGLAENHNITSVLSVASNLPTGFLDPIKNITNCEATALYVLDDREKCFKYSSSICLDGKKDTALEIAGIVNKQIQSDRKPLWVGNVSTHHELSSLNRDIKSFLAVPLIIKKQIIGILYLYNKRATRFSPFLEFTPEELRLIASFTHQIAIAIENHRLNTDIHDIFLDYITSISAALDARDAYTHGHSKRVAEFSVGLAKELGFTEGELEFMRLSATVHDIGKIGISEEVLNKPDRLTEEEFMMIQSHPMKGSKILEPMSRLHALMPGIRNHHERYDGKGYPDGLKGEENHLVARIISIADTYDAMTSDRVYRKGLPVEVAYQEIEKGAGTQFDPKLAMEFISFMKKQMEIKRQSVAGRD